MGMEVNLSSLFWKSFGISFRVKLNGFDLSLLCQ